MCSCDCVRLFLLMFNMSCDLYVFLWFIMSSLILSDLLMFLIWFLLVVYVCFFCCSYDFLWLCTMFLWCPAMSYEFVRFSFDCCNDCLWVCTMFFGFSHDFYRCTIFFFCLMIFCDCVRCSSVCVLWFLVVLYDCLLMFLMISCDCVRFLRILLWILVIV